ncbi:hypothetical protein SNE40_001665 [Patella caerulea]
MSDRAATEKKFHDLLKEYREDILPLIYSNWESLTESEQDSYSSMNNFYCGLHLLVNMAETAQKMLLTVEKEELEKPGISESGETSKFVSAGESVSVRMIRTITKCLARGGDEKSGCYKDFKSFILGKEKEEEYMYSGPSKHRLLVPFRGNRFNILFYDAEAVFYLSKYIIEFFSANLLHKAVFFDIKETYYIAACKSLGLCSKFIMSPLWRIIESNVSVQEISDTYQTLHSFFLNTQKDVSGFMCGDDIPFPDQVNKDELYERLIMPDDNDAKTAVILQHLFSVWSSLIKKSVVADHLESGKYKNISTSLAKETKSVPLHNKFPERVFAFLDALIRFRPSASTLCYEAHIMFCLNKTGKWLDELPPEEKEKVLNDNEARSEGREMRKKFKGRMEEIENKCSESLRKKRIQIEKKKSKELELKEELTKSILFHGLWQFPETVDSNLQDMKSEAEKRKALRTQLQFRKVVLGQTVSDKKIFQLSEKGVLYSTKKSTPKENIFVSKEIVHYQNVNGVRTAFDGRVISSVPGYNEWYNVVYKGDNAVYVYKLAEDYEAGDLVIKP